MSSSAISANPDCLPRSVAMPVGRVRGILLHHLDGIDQDIVRARCHKTVGLGKNNERPVPVKKPGTVSASCKKRCRGQKRRASPPPQVLSAGNVECYMTRCSCECHRIQRA